MTKSRFDIEYNKWLRQIDVGEDDSVWNEIQDELDFIETWENISVKLDEIKPRNVSGVPMKYLKVLAAAAIILIMFLPVRYFIKQANKPTIISELSKEAVEKEELISDDTSPQGAIKEEVEVDNRIVTEFPPGNSSFEKSLASSSSDELTPIIESKDSEGTVYITEVFDVHKIQNLPFDANTLTGSNDAISTNLIDTEFNNISEPTKSSGISFRVVDLGLVYGFKNTWLLNHETRNGLKSGKLGATLPTFHQDNGVSSTLEFNNQYLFGLEFLWKSEVGQNYEQYINASYVEKNIILDYLKVQAFYLWNNNRIPGQAIMGGYVARLGMAEKQQAGTIISIDDSYSDLDYGLLAGYQFNIALKNSINIKPSIRVSYNLVNIFEGDEITPSYFKTTKNLAVSFNISLSYRVF